MKREDIFRPWLAVRVVALLGPGMSVKLIQNWSDRELVDDLETPKPGKNNPRLYSLANAIQLHGMCWATKNGITVSIATLIGRKCVERLLELNESGQVDPCLIHTLDDKIMNFIVRDGSKDIWASFLTPEELSDYLKKTGFTTPDGTFGMQLRVDGLISSVLRSYWDVNEDFNAKALAGKLKPFPKYLE